MNGRSHALVQALRAKGGSLLFCNVQGARTARKEKPGAGPNESAKEEKVPANGIGGCFGPVSAAAGTGTEHEHTGN